MIGLGLFGARRCARAPALLRTALAPGTAWATACAVPSVPNVPVRGKKKMSFRKKQWLREKWRHKWIGTKAELDLGAARAASLREGLVGAFGAHSTSSQVEGGDLVMGRVVGAKNRKFRVVDFGLKKEITFPRAELVGARELGDQVAYPFVRQEDEFREPELDYSRATALPPVQAARTLLLSKVEKGAGAQQIIRGRVMGVVKAGFLVRALGHDFFMPATQALGLPDPMIGRYFNFLLLKVESFVYQQRSGGPGRDGPPGGSAGASSNAVPYTVQFQGVVSAYASSVPILANLVGRDEAWKQSGGGSSRDRLAYLRLLTRMVYKRNPHVRKQMLSKPEPAPTYTRASLGDEIENEPLVPSYGRNFNR
ncbi:30S ribosomal protein S1 [Porphyridium purpureum]|uniref:30S ribosomal protein S1 n=1 Tax=Porphyridium purpureum TaxID=35688 RepID=A0A5J4YSR6_PORPP|nr:30S ribosomal protein S1 [Porphyridium purpureum]|eukprot:POR9060..scf229_5